MDRVDAILKVNTASAVAANADGIVKLASAFGQLEVKLVGIAGWIGKNPALAGLLLGGATGARFGGVPGMLVGGVAGLVGGKMLGDAADDANTDPAFRRDKLKSALSYYNQIKAQHATGNYADGGLLKLAQQDLVKQTQLTTSALAQNKADAVSAAAGAKSGDGSLGNYLGGGGGGGSRGGKTASTYFGTESVRLDTELLQAKRALLTDQDAIAAIAARQSGCEKIL